VADAGWFERTGISRQLRRKYTQNGWLISPARGVYMRPGLSGEKAKLSWQQLVVSLGLLMNQRVSVGGRTALELQGYAHYLEASGEREVHLYTVKALPGWVSQIPMSCRLVFHNAGRLFPAGVEALSAASAGSSEQALAKAGFAVHPWGSPGGTTWSLTVSTLERAILELLDELPNRETFHQADVLVEGLRNLSPRRLEALLADCKSVKVKRLFLWFAERHNHVWLQRLDRSRINLGKGKRMLVRGGKLDPKYNIIVPENLDGVQ
jgi:hypothetical protein